MNTASTPASALIVLNEDQFDEQFRPVKNHLVADASFSGNMFETYGAEYDYVMTVDPAKVWTIINTDGTQSITSGVRKINCAGFLVTEVAVPAGTTVDVEIEDEEEED